MWTSLPNRGSVPVVFAHGDGRAAHARVAVPGARPQRRCAAVCGRAAFAQVFARYPGFAFEVHRVLLGDGHSVLDGT